MPQRQQESLSKKFKRCSALASVSLMALATIAFSGVKPASADELNNLATASGAPNHSLTIEGGTPATNESITAGDNQNSPFYNSFFLPLILAGGALSLAGVGYAAKRKLDKRKKELDEEKKEFDKKVKAISEREKDLSKNKEALSAKTAILAEREKSLKEKEMDLAQEKENLPKEAEKAAKKAHKKTANALKKEWERFKNEKEDLEREYAQLERTYDSIESTKYLIDHLKEDLEKKMKDLNEKEAELAEKDMLLSMQAMQNIMSGGPPGGPKENKKKKFEPVDPAKNKTRLKDVAGMDDIMGEVTEIVDFIKTKEKFEKVGAKPPKGALLYGDPGTGKTLLAQAIAGETGLPFFSVSGSEFVNKFVGQGAANVRELFKEARESAKKHGGAIIFIDELDAVGKQRTGGEGSDEREQTLNQLLAEMNDCENITVIGATNFRETLDTALTRPGRFDRDVNVKLPDLEARKLIAAVHMKDKPLDDDVSVDKIARNTFRRSGAYIAKLVNEAAIFAARRDADSISSEDFDKATEKCSMGIEGKMTDDLQEKEDTAKHEAGHGAMGALLEDYCHNKLNGGTITPRGGSLGRIMFAPERDLTGQRKTEMLAWVYIALSGQVAEEVTNGKNNIGTGASQDLKVATATLREMAEKYGMFPEEVGSASHGGNTSEAYKEKIENFVNKKIKDMKKEVTDILTKNIVPLRNLTQTFVDKETLTAQEIRDALGALEGIPSIFTEETKKISFEIKHRKQRNLQNPLIMS